MVILLDGSSRMGRITIAENAIEAHPAWKHLALEVIEEATPDDEEKDFHLQVIRRCAEELEKENMHLFLTMPGDEPNREPLALALKPKCITVHLGDEEDGEYDHVIDPSSKTVNDVTKFLDAIMAPYDA
jgi:hypothetical protein